MTVAGAELYRPGKERRSTGRDATGVLVLAGSSGRVDRARVDLLTGLGLDAAGLQWFGGPGQPARARAVPLETVTGAVDALARDCARVVLMGLSYGAEAVLLAAARDPRVDAVVALAPTDVAWEGDRLGDDDPPVSKWTWQGRGLPFVPLVQDAGLGPDPAFVEVYRRSRERAGAAVVRDAAIPAEQIRGQVVLVAGGDDQVWPSAQSARRLAARRPAGTTTLVVDAGAGHRVLLPGEPDAGGERPYRLGGDHGSAQRLGRAAWPAIRAVLGLGA